MLFEYPTDKSDAHDIQTRYALSFLLQNLATSGFEPGFSEEAAYAHKARLERIVKHLPAIGHRLLSTFHALAHELGIHPGKLALFVVGGRVRGTPIKDSTDFDLVLTAEHELTPFGKHPTITFPQRHAIARALYEEIESCFHVLGIWTDYEPGILELKGFGERTSEILEREHDTLKIIEEP